MDTGTLDVGHGPVKILFLSLIFCLMPMTPCGTMLYWPHTSALVAYNGGTSVGNGPAKTLFLEPDFVLPVLAHWMLAMALSRLFSWA